MSTPSHTPEDASMNQSDDSMPEADKTELPQKVVDKLQSVPEPERKEIIATLEHQMSVLMSTSYRGPIPPPEMLRELEVIVPGSAKEILDMSVQQSKHRRAMEEHVIKAQTKESGRGQLLGFIIGTLVILVSGALIYTDHDVAGGVLGSLDLIGLVSIFVLGKKQQRKELQEKNKADKLQELIENAQKK